MKKSIIFAFIINIYLQLVAQCDPRYSIKPSEKPDHFIKVFEAFMPYENDTMLTFTLLLNKGIKYRLDFYESSEFQGKASYSLYEEDKLLGTNYSKETNKSFPSFEFICTKSLVYTVVIKKLYEGKYCASWSIQEIKEPVEDESAINKTRENPIEKTFILADEMPEFKEGDKNYDKFREWIQNNISEKIKEQNIAEITGKIYVTFVVTENGSVDDVKIVRGLDIEIDKLVLNLVKSSPKWEKPGKLGGKYVRVSFTFPVYINKELKK